MFQSYALLSLFDDNDEEVTPLKSAVCGVKSDLLLNVNFICFSVIPSSFVFLNHYFVFNVKNFVINSYK